MSAVTPFKISIPASELDLLSQKLALARLPRHIANEKWGEDNGVTVSAVSSVLDFWRTKYDWRAEEARLNAMPQFMTTVAVDGFGDVKVHFAHSPASSSKDAIPLLFLHGWPGSFAEIAKALPELNKAGFNVVAPSLPGYGFSSYPDKEGFKHVQHAECMHKVMGKLGYGKYVVQGGDWGAFIVRTLGIKYPEAVMAVHTNMVSTIYYGVSRKFYMERAVVDCPNSGKDMTAYRRMQIMMGKPPFDKEPDYNAFEKASLERAAWFSNTQAAYLQLQSTKPRTLGFAMHDSPVGMLAWMMDKLNMWSDAYAWTPTEYITWTLLHYFPGPTTGFQMYKENNQNEMAKGLQANEYCKPPTGVSAFPKELGLMPRSWAETKANIVFWQEHPSGGHFAMYERPKELAGDLVKFYKSVWKN